MPSSFCLDMSGCTLPSNNTHYCATICSFTMVRYIHILSLRHFANVRETSATADAGMLIALE